MKVSKVAGLNVLGVLSIFVEYNTTSGKEVLYKKVTKPKIT
jgi:hypothetical protein